MAESLPAAAPLLVLDLARAALAAHTRFEPFREGVEICRLYDDPASGAAAALLRYAPGASVPEHVHRGYEHVLILEGEQSDASGSYAVGSFVVNGPGTRHAVKSLGGCLALLIWQHPVEFVNTV